jgi:lipid II:glycine glycyltransferase (peptidoglycan interpeptide bridge formation enzyme)
VDVEMLRVSYKIKGLTLNEFWFSSEISVDTSSLFAFSCYRDTSVDIESSGLKKEKKYTLLNDLTEEKDKIFSRFKPNVRNQIRKFDKIEEFTCTSNYESKALFLEFYSHFAEAKHLPKVEENSIDKYNKNLFYICGYLEGILTNMQVYLIDKESHTVRLLHSISTLYEEEDKHRHAKIGWINRYLHWHTMLHFKEEGFQTFDWGGYTNDANSPLAGIDKFKAAFGGEKVVLYNYYTLGYYALKVIQEKVL